MGEKRGPNAQRKMVRRGRTLRENGSRAAEKDGAGREE